MAFINPEEFLKGGYGSAYGGSYPSFRPSEDLSLEGLLGEAAEYDDKGVFEGLIDKFRKDDSDAEADLVEPKQGSVSPTASTQDKNKAMDLTLADYKKAMTQARAAKTAYDANPKDPLLKSIYNDKDAYAQFYQDKMRSVGWSENVPNPGDVIDKENYIIYSSEEDMANEVGGSPIYYKRSKPGRTTRYVVQ